MPALPAGNNEKKPTQLQEPVEAGSVAYQKGDKYIPRLSSE